MSHTRDSPVEIATVTGKGNGSINRASGSWAESDRDRPILPSRYVEGTS